MKDSLEIDLHIFKKLEATAFLTFELKSSEKDATVGTTYISHSSTPTFFAKALNNLAAITLLSSSSSFASTKIKIK